jgi:predicted enzyme related to lactoylglutathione lyase
MSGTHGTVIWFEIWVSDLERAKAFYSGLFGWTYEPLSDYDASGGYQQINAGDAAGVNGALVNAPGRERPASRGTVLYVHVPDLADAIDRAQSLGGTLVQKPTLISASAGTFAIVTDTEGNDLGLWVA